MRFRETLLLWIFFLTLACHMAPVQAGGTDQIFGRMGGWVEEMQAGGAMSAKEAKRLKAEMDELKEKVDARLKENGGIINLQAGDKDLQSEIDAFGDPLLKRYQQFKGLD